MNWGTSAAAGNARHSRTQPSIERIRVAFMIISFGFV
jgi:hypothetical protein